MKAREDSSWGVPRFAMVFPSDPQLDALVQAFARGDYGAVRAGVPAFDDRPDDIRKAAARLLEGTKPDPTAKLLFVMTAALLAFLMLWWSTHDGPPESPPPASERAR